MEETKRGTARNKNNNKKEMISSSYFVCDRKKE